MNTNNDVTGDRITNALKGDKEKYRENWEAIFGKKNQTVEDTDKILDEITRLDQEMGLYHE